MPGEFALSCAMPYKNDPRRTITLNLHAEEYAALAADAAPAGYASPGTYALALVRARGAAPPPVVDKNGRVHLARLQGKLEAVRDTLAAAEMRAATLRGQLREAQQELLQRPTYSQIQQQITAAVAEAISRPASEKTPMPLEAPREQRLARRRKI